LGEDPFEPDWNSSANVLQQCAVRRLDLQAITSCRAPRSLLSRRSVANDATEFIAHSAGSDS